MTADETPHDTVWRDIPGCPGYACRPPDQILSCERWIQQPDRWTRATFRRRIPPRLMKTRIKSGRLRCELRGNDQYVSIAVQDVIAEVWPDA